MTGTSVKPKGFAVKAMAISITAVVAVTVALPAAADCVRRDDAGANGAVIGALAGAAIGNGTSGRHTRGTGTVAGAIVGAVAGSAIARGNTHCAYDDYDDDYYDSGYDRRYDDRRYDDRYDRRSYGYSYHRVYTEPRVVYVEPRRYYYRERVYYEPRGYRGHSRHHRHYYR